MAYEICAERQCTLQRVAGVIAQLGALERTHEVVGVGSEPARRVRHEPTAVICETRRQRPKVEAVSVEHRVEFGVAEMTGGEVLNRCEQTKSPLGPVSRSVDSGCLSGDHLDE